jgi:hypothetical protein
VDVLPLPIPGIIGFSCFLAASEDLSCVEKYRSGDDNDGDGNMYSGDNDESVALLVVCCIGDRFHRDGLRCKRPRCWTEPAARAAMRHRGVNRKLMVNMYVNMSLPSKVGGSNVVEKR